MAFTDIFKTRRSAKIHRRAWQVVWERVKTPPAGDAAARELHVVFVGTLLYTTRYQAARAAGMEDTIAKTVALQAVGQAEFDEQMRDRVLAAFSARAEGRAAEYAATLSSLIAAVIDQTESRGEAQSGESLDGLLDRIVELMPLLSEGLAAAD